jgi:hypothetical protein
MQMRIAGCSSILGLSATSLIEPPFSPPTRGPSGPLVLPNLRFAAILTRFWHTKHHVLVGFYRFAISRGYCAVSPLPTCV